jgi:maleylpyruvate isomerase
MLRLHDYFRSGTSHRVRIALNLKGVNVERAFVNLAKHAHKESSYLALNPQGFAPALEVEGHSLTQSPAILEWLEETYPDPPLLPRDPIARAKVRAMAALVACDVHPLNNMRVLARLRDAYGQDEAAIKAWAVTWIEAGFSALEELIADAPRNGPWCWGAAPTLADCTIVPQVYAAISRYGYDIPRHPNVARVYEAAATHPAFLAAHPTAQPDAT